MSNSKKSNRLDTENALSKLMQEIQNQNFETKEQLDEFLQKMQGISLDDLPKSTSNKGRSQDMVFEAYEQSVPEGKKLIEEALELDPDNADAYNYLASVETDVDKALVLYKQAIEAGERSLGVEFMKENKGHFWGLIETRPYMRAKAGLAECLFAKNRINAAIDIYREMLELNPGDNQGVRYLLAIILVSKKDLSDYESFVKNFEEEDCAAWHYNNALYHFKKLGKSAESDKQLLKAYKNNKYVADYMLGMKELPKEMPTFIGRGDEDEAVAYVIDAWPAWRKTDGPMDWLYEFVIKMRKMN